MNTTIAPAKRTAIVSPPIAPGEEWSNVVMFPRGCHLELLRQPDNEAWLPYQRLAELGAGECLSYFGRPLQGLYLRVRNDTAEARAFYAVAVTRRDPGIVQQEVELLAEDAWKRGGDALTVEELELHLAARDRRAPR
jgi:hypothetical protein